MHLMSDTKRLYAYHKLIGDRVILTLKKRNIQLPLFKSNWPDHYIE